MGVRLYNPTTGRILSTDPIYGGNFNAYSSPVNPIDDVDTDGRAARPGSVKPCECGQAGGGWRIASRGGAAKIKSPGVPLFEIKGLYNQIALIAARVNARYGKTIITNLGDPRYKASMGWVKKQQVFETSYGKIAVHYVYNTRSGKAVDFKIVRSLR